MRTVKIFVGSISEKSKASDLKNMFRRYGEVSECDIVSNYGFVHMPNEKCADEAINSLNGVDLDGSRIFVTLSNKDSEKPDRTNQRNNRNGGSRPRGRGRLFNGRRPRGGQSRVNSSPPIDYEPRSMISEPSYMPERYDMRTPAATHVYEQRAPVQMGTSRFQVSGRSSVERIISNNISVSSSNPIGYYPYPEYPTMETVPIPTLNADCDTYASSKRRKRSRSRSRSQRRSESKHSSRRSRNEHSKRSSRR